MGRTTALLGAAHLRKSYRAGRAYKISTVYGIPTPASSVPIAYHCRRFLQNTANGAQLLIVEPTTIHTYIDSAPLHLYSVYDETT